MTIPRIIPSIALVAGLLALGVQDARAGGPPLGRKKPAARSASSGSAAASRARGSRAASGLLKLELKVQVTSYARVTPAHPQLGGQEVGDAVNERPTRRAGRRGAPPATRLGGQDIGDAEAIVKRHARNSLSSSGIDGLRLPRPGTHTGRGQTLSVQKVRESARVSNGWAWSSLDQPRTDERSGYHFPGTAWEVDRPVRR